MGEESVRVAVRIRPLIETELEKGYQNCLEVFEDEHQIHFKGTDKAFTFDHVFDSSVSQSVFYDTAVKSMINNIFKGYNVTVLAYGQTGSGKTYSMGTNYCEDDVGSEGIIPQAVTDMFQQISSSTDHTFQVNVSFMELYNEQLYDLLSEKQRKDSVVEIREDQKGIKFTSLTEKPVKSSAEVLKLLILGSQSRATGSTAMNSQSSRSHAVFTITVHHQEKGNPRSAKTSKFHLVDLAGSERSKKTQATGDRFKEGININKGLLALGNVISQLGDNNHVAGSFVCYRDSKLTRLLQDSLGGNSVTLMIACVSPADFNMEETLSTLRYADRAKKIKNKPIVNQDPKVAEINRLNTIIRELQLELINQNGSPRSSCPPEHENLIEKNRLLTTALVKFTSNLNQTVLMNEKVEVIQRIQLEISNELNLILEDLKMLMDGETDEEKIQRLNAIYIKIRDLIDDNKKVKDESNADFDNSIMTSSLSLSANLSGNQSNLESLDSTQNVDEKQEELALRQVERHSAMLDIDNDIFKKEELIAELMKASQISNYQKILEDTEKELKALQTEKEELIEKLKNNVCAKLAETRRQKVQELEKKITDLQRKLVEQSRIIKSKEKSEELIRTLRNEVQSLKQHKIKLIREMKKESEKFNQLKLQRDRQVQKLENQDRKRQNEFTKLKIQCDKQKSVLKRKLEEASNVNKRLRDALEKQKMYKKNQREKLGSAEAIQNIVIHELSMMCRLVDAEFSLKKMMNDREVTTKEINDLKAKATEDPETNYDEHIKSLEEYLASRNNQIAEVQQKIIETKDELENNPKWKPSKLDDAELALKMSNDFAVSCQKKINTQNQDYNDLMEKYDKSLLHQRVMEIEIKNLKEKLENLESTKATNHKKQKKAPPVNKRLAVVMNENTVDDMNSTYELDYDDDINKDPDWTRTPLYKRLRSFTRQPEGAKRSFDGEIKCACKKKCTSRLCTCRKNFQACGENCDCTVDLCNNKNQEEASQPFFPDVTFDLEATQVNTSKRIKFEDDQSQD